MDANAGSIEKGNTDQSDVFTDVCVCVCTNLIGQYFLSEFDWILNDAHTQRFANNIGFVRKSKHIFKMNNNFVSTVFHDVNQTCS